MSVNLKRFAVGAVMLSLFVVATNACVFRYWEPRWPPFRCLAYYDAQEVFFDNITDQCRTSKDLINNLTKFGIYDEKGCILYQIHSIKINGSEKTFESNPGFVESLHKILSIAPRTKRDQKSGIKEFYIEGIVDWLAHSCGHEFEKVQELPSTKWGRFYDCVQVYLFQSIERTYKFFSDRVKWGLADGEVNWHMHCK